MISKLLLGSKNFKVWPSKSEVSNAKWDFGGSKKYFGPPETQKIHFLKKSKFLFWLNIGGGSPNGPGHPGTIRPQYLIQKLATLLWPSVLQKCKLTF